MKCRFLIRRNSDGAVRVLENYDWDDEEWLWSEGNFGCDCNRSIIFNRIGGNHDPEYGCGEGGFSIRIFAALDGRLIYEDQE